MKQAVLTVALCALSVPVHASDARLHIRARTVTHYDLCAEGKTQHCPLVAESRRAEFCREYPDMCTLVMVALNTPPRQ